MESLSDLLKLLDLNPFDSFRRKSSSHKKLESNTIKGIADFIKENDVKSIIVLTGAGISTAAGIPDFRSPDSGLYDNLQHYDLPYPEAIFNISFFKNIDTLEHVAGLPSDKVVEAHGTFHTSHCLSCKAFYDFEWMQSQILKLHGPPKCDRCFNVVKPDIVFFGENLPRNFFAHLSDFKRCDLLIVMGTSLIVQPFASLPSHTPISVPRLLINKEKVSMNSSIFSIPTISSIAKKNDVFYMGSCDDGCLKLAEELGWKEELIKFAQDKLRKLFTDRGKTCCLVYTSFCEGDNGMPASILKKKVKRTRTMGIIQHGSFSSNLSLFMAENNLARNVGKRILENGIGPPINHLNLES